MRTYSFVSRFRERHFYQTAVYDRSAPPRTIVHAVRMSPSQRDGMHYISEMGILRHSALVICKYAPTVPVMDIRHCRLHRLLSAVHDLYKFSSIMTERTLNDEKTKRLFCSTRKLIGKFLRRLTRRLAPRLNRITNRRCRRRLKDCLQKHLPLFILRLLKKSKLLGQLLTVFMDIKYRLIAGASMVSALEGWRCKKFYDGVRILIMSTRNSHVDWDFPGLDPYLHGLSILKPEYC